MLEEEKNTLKDHGEVLVRGLLRGRLGKFREQHVSCGKKNMFQLIMVSCWFGAFSGLGFDSKGTPKNPKGPFHFRGFQISKPPGPKPTIHH